MKRSIRNARPQNRQPLTLRTERLEDRRVMTAIGGFFSGSIQPSAQIAQMAIGTADVQLALPIAATPIGNVFGSDQGIRVQPQINFDVRAEYDPVAGRLSVQGTPWNDDVRVRQYNGDGILLRR